MLFEMTTLIKILLVGSGLLSVSPISVDDKTSVVIMYVCMYVCMHVY